MPPRPNMIIRETRLYAGEKFKNNFGCCPNVLCKVNFRLEKQKEKFVVI